MMAASAAILVVEAAAAALVVGLLSLTSVVARTVHHTSRVTFRHSSGRPTRAPVTGSCVTCNADEQLHTALKRSRHAT